VISVRFDFGPVQEAGHYSKRIAFFCNTRAAFLQFDVQRLHALGFLNPQPPKFYESFRFVRKRRKHDRRHDAVPEVLPARDRSGEGLQDARKLRIDLPGVLHPVCHSNPGRARGRLPHKCPARAPEIARTGGIRFDYNGSSLLWKRRDHFGCQPHV